jgi:hypothetical protein
LDRGHGGKHDSQRGDPERAPDHDARLFVLISSGQLLDQDLRAKWIKRSVSRSLLRLPEVAVDPINQLIIA